MKKIIGLFILFFATQTAFSQTTETSLILGGTGTINSQFTDGSSSTTILFNPTIGYFINEKFAVGGTPTIGLFSFDDNTEFAAGLTGFTRVYFNTDSRNVFYAHGDGGFFSPEDGISNTFFNLGLGMASFLSPNVVLETQATYGVNNPEDGSTSNNIQLSSGLKIYLNRNQDKSSFSLPFGTGSILIGGTSGLFRVDFDENDNNTTLIQLNPNAAFFINEKSAIGASLNFGFSQVEFGGGFGKFSATSVLFTPFYRFYIPTDNSKNAWFLTAGGGFNFSVLDGDFTGRVNNTSGVIFLGGGIDIFLSPTTAVELATSYFLNFDDGESVGRIGLDVGFQYFISKE